MNLQTKAILYNFLGFAPIYFSCYYVLLNITTITGFWLPLISALVAIVFAPKFQAVQTQNGKKLFVKWLFKKGVKEIK